MKFKYIILCLLLTFSLTSCSDGKLFSSSLSSNSASNLPSIEDDEKVTSNDEDDKDEASETTSSESDSSITANSDVVISIDELSTKGEPKLDEIIPAIDNVLGEYKDNVALYYYNFDSKDEYYFNEDIYYLSASLKKIPLAMQVLDKVYQGEFTLDTMVEYESTDYMNGTGILQFEDEIGSRSIRELVVLSMTESDNIAFNMLNRLCGKTLIEYTNNMLGYDAMIIENDYTKLTARHNFEILYNLYTNVNSNPYYSIIIDSLKKTAFNDSLDKYLPKDKVAHKIGSYFRSYHDAGIIFGDETYILIMLTKDVGTLTDSPEFTEDEEERILIDWGKEAFELIAQVSKSVFDIIQN